MKTTQDARNALEAAISDSLTDEPQSATEVAVGVSVVAPGLGATKQQVAYLLRALAARGEVRREGYGRWTKYSTLDHTRVPLAMGDDEVPDIVLEVIEEETEPEDTP